MENPLSDNELQAYFDRFMKSFVESRDPRMDLEIGALKQLRGSYLEKAKAAILKRMESVPSSDAISSALAIHFVEVVPLMKKWLGEIRSNPASKHNHPYTRGQLAYGLYEFTKDDEYTPDIIYVIEHEGYGEFTNGVYMLSKMPLKREGLAAVWNKYRKGKAIKEPHSWWENCAWFLREKIKEPLGQQFLSSLPDEEQKELLELIGESGHQRLERKFRMERYIYGRERYSKEDVNRYDEYIKVGGSPVKGMTLKDLWKGHTAQIFGMKWSPDGRYMASYSEDDTVRIWSLDPAHTVQVFQQKKDYPYSRNRPQKVTWTFTNGEKLAVLYDNFQTASKDQYNIVECEIVSGKMNAPLYGTPERASMNDMLYLFDQRAFLLCHWNALYHFSRTTRQPEQVLKEYKGRFGTVSLSPNGRVAALVYNELKDPKTGIEYHPGLYGEGVPQEVLFYDVVNRKVIRRFDTGHIKGINKLCWMPGKPVLVVASTDNTISIWDLQTNKRIKTLESQGFVGSILDLAFSSNGMLLVSRSYEDKLIRIWRTDTWEEVVALRELSGYSLSFAFHPSLPIFTSVCSLRAADDNSSGDSPAAIRVWEFDYDAFLSNPPFMEEFNRRENEFRSRLLREDITEDLEDTKIGASPAMGIRLRRVLRGHTDRIQGICWSPDGQYLASPSNDKTVRIWDESTGECISILEESDEIRHCAWAPDGQGLVYGGNQQIKLWNGKDAASSEILAGDFQRLDSLVYSPDGKRLALAYGYNTIQILDTSTWKEVNKKVFDTRSNHRINLQWSDDSRQLIANPIIGWIQIRDAQTLELRSKIEIPGERDETYSFSFMYAKYGNKAAVAEEKKPIMILDLFSGQVERQMTESTSYTSGLTFSPDGGILVSWSHDDSVHFWRPDTGQKLARIHEYSRRMIEPVYPSFHPTKPSLVTFCEKRHSMRIWDIDYSELLK